MKLAIFYRAVKIIDHVVQMPNLHELSQDDLLANLDLTTEIGMALAVKGILKLFNCLKKLNIEYIFVALSH